MTTAAVLEELRALETRVAALRQSLAIGGMRERAPATAELLVCGVDGVEVAWNLDEVIEVLPAASVVPVPESKPWLLGFLNLRGDALPVFHLGARFEGRARRIERDDFIVVLSDRNERAGVVVSEILGVRPFDSTRFQAETAIGRGPYILGTCHDGDRVSLVLSFAILFATSDLPNHLLARGAEDT